MMRKNITRTLTRATVKAFTVKMVDGLPVVESLEPVHGWGNLTEKEAQKLVKDAHGIGNATIGEITYAQESYRLSIDKFVEVAEMIDISEVENEDEIDEEEND